MNLPAAFIDQMKPWLSEAEMQEFIDALTTSDSPTSVRWNMEKLRLSGCTSPLEDDVSLRPVPWCKTGTYLAERPQFTLDPRLHGGLYYVQEASSQFVSHVVEHLFCANPAKSQLFEAQLPITTLDLCAAPGGKSTAVLSALPEESVLVSNEIDRKRARVLAENIQKWGNPNVCVTANAPVDFRTLGETFDLIVADVPCSGEGMFRKDAGAIDEWSPAKVNECAALQRSILADIWPCLKPDGYLIYSTCTFNVAENEANLQFIHDSLGGEIIPIPVETNWHIHPALTGPFAPDVRSESACRFMPHYTEGEGLFMALIHTPAMVSSGTHRTSAYTSERKTNNKEKGPDFSAWLCSKDFTILPNHEGMYIALSEKLKPLYDKLVSAKLYLLSAGVELGTIKGKDVIPAHALALSTALRPEAFPCADIDLETALSYLRRDTIVLPPNIPRGFVLLTYTHIPLGFVKNIGNRCNSLYPMEWRIRRL